MADGPNQVSTSRINVRQRSQAQPQNRSAQTAEPKPEPNLTAPSIKESWEQCAYDAVNRMRSEHVGEYLEETAWDVAGSAALCYKIGKAMPLCVGVGVSVGQRYALKKFAAKMEATEAPARLECKEKLPMSSAQQNTIEGNLLLNNLEQVAVPFPFLTSMFANRVKRPCNSTLKGCNPCQDVENGCNPPSKPSSGSTAGTNQGRSSGATGTSRIRTPRTQD